MSNSYNCEDCGLLVPTTVCVQCQTKRNNKLTKTAKKEDVIELNKSYVKKLSKLVDEFKFKNLNHPDYQSKLKFLLGYLEGLITLVEEDHGHSSQDVEKRLAEYLTPPSKEADHE